MTAINITTADPYYGHQPKLKPASAQTFKRTFSVPELTASKGSAFSASDTVDIMDIEAGMVITGVRMYIDTAMSGGSVSSPTMALGDEDTAAGFMALTAIDATAGTITIGNGSYFLSQSGTVPYAVTAPFAKAYTAAKLLRASFGGTAGTAGVISVEVDYIKMQSAV